MGGCCGTLRVRQQRRAIASQVGWYWLLALASLLTLSMSVPAHGADDESYFDPLVTIAPGISRELDVLFDHSRAARTALTLMSAKLQYPVTPWLQFSLEMPVGLLDQDTGSPETAAGDLLVVGQAALLRSRQQKLQLDAGVELTLPTGSPSVLAGSTGVRPFVSAALKAGPFDLIADLSHQWVVAGPTTGAQFFQANGALGYPLGRITPFVELSLIQPLQRGDDRRSQLYALPGLELFLRENLSLSLGVQLPISAARSFDQRVLGFLKWQF